MTCPVCKRELAPTISICYTCGTMVQDSVREELATKIGRISKPLAMEMVEDAIEEMTSRTPDVIAFAEPAPEAKPSVPAPPTIESPQRPKADPTERISRHTSPTLVGFQNPRSNVPDWRLHLQNSVRQRKSEPVAEQPLIPGLHTHLVTNGNAALKAQYVPEPESSASSDPRLESALKRIEDSRRKFSGEIQPSAAPAPAAPKRHPFNVVEGTRDPAPSGARPATVNTLPKPRLVPSTGVTPRKGLDTNKLPPIAEIPEVSVSDISVVKETPEVPAQVFEPVKIEIAASGPLIPDAAPYFDDEVDEIDDLAPLSTRFIAGLFDAIIGCFATAILMSPLLIGGGEWLSLSGIIAIAAAFGIVMFTYTTVGLGLRGRTLGMKIFALEVIDIEENEYPTFHQAAVRSAVFLLSLPLLGIGFATVFFNEERRAAHDLVSGTILVREL